MPGANDGVAMEQVIGAHFDAQQAAHQSAHRGQGIVDSLEQNGVIIDRHARPQQRLAHPSGFRGDLARMIEMRLNPHFAGSRQQVDQAPVVQLLRQRHRHARADADDVDVLDGRQVLQVEP